MSASEQASVYNDFKHSFRPREAGYDLRAATRSLGSDFAYARHSARAQYSVRVHKEYISASFTAGLMNGRAPLFDRFILGNANTLRGYNKYDVALQPRRQYQGAPLSGGRSHQRPQAGQLFLPRGISIARGTGRTIVYPGDEFLDASAAEIRSVMALCHARVRRVMLVANQQVSRRRSVVNYLSAHRHVVLRHCIRLGWNRNPRVLFRR